MAGAITELRLACRSLAKDAGLSMLVVASLSLGIGVVVTIVSLANALLVRPVRGVGGIDELVTVTPRPVEIPGLPGRFHVPVSTPDFREYRDSGALADLAAYYPLPVHVARGEQVARLEAELVSTTYFPVLQVSAAAGRLFSARDPSSHDWPYVAVLGEGLWRSWGGDPRLLGEVIRLNGSPFVVVGVAGHGFHGPRLAGTTEVWIPIAAAERVLPGMDRLLLDDADHGWLFWFVGRLRSGMSPELAQQRLDSVAAALGEQRSDGPPALAVEPGIGLRADEKDAAKASLGILIGVAGFLLLTACLNAAVLLLSRMVRRRGESSVRLALGAPRRRLVRQLLAESMTLTAIATAGGVVLALLATRLSSVLDFAGLLPDPGQVRVDPTVLAVALVLGLGAAMLATVIPALRACRLQPAAGLHGRGWAGGRGDVAQHLLLVGQIAVGLVLLAAAGLLARSLWNHLRIDPGFDLDVVNVRFDLERQGYGENAGYAFFERAIEEVESLPGVETASLAWSVPLARETAAAVAQVGPASGSRAGVEEAFVGYNLVGPRYLHTLDIGLLRGRDLTPSDDANAPRVVVVDEGLAELFWPDVDPIGQRMRMGEEELRVVGVAATVRTGSLTGPPTPHFYLPLLQSYRSEVTLHVRSAAEPGELLQAIARRFSRLDPHLPLYEQGRMHDQLRTSLARPRLAAAFVGSMAVLALTLSAIGVAGVAYRTAHARARESSVRVAVGARRGDLLWLYIRRGLVAAGGGVAAGLVGVVLLARSLSALLYQVSPREPAVLAVVVAVVLVVVVVANALPAYFATRIDPARLLQQD
jgi:putative ABC transport system permease protein